MHNVKEGLQFDDAKRLVIQTAKDNQKIALYMAIGFFTGLRHSDIIRATRSQLNDNRITMYEKKTEKYTVRTLPKSFYSLIECIDLDQLPNVLFLNKRGSKIMNYSYIVREVQGYMVHYLGKDKKVVATHTLRKTFGRRFYNLHPNKSDAAIKLQYYFNHASVQTTLIYLGITQTEITDVIELF